MDLLEVPLEAAAFRLYSLPAAAALGSAWACLALLAAAALGLLGFRAVGYKSPENTSSSPPPPPPDPIPAQHQLPPPPEKPALELAPVALPAFLHLEEPSCSFSTPKARFTAYYCAAESDDGGGGGGGASYGQEEVDRRPAAETWDGAADVRRRGDLGWYRFQDMSALNGSVVKLWERCDGQWTAPTLRR